MFIDEMGTLVRDQNSDFDGARGDSCFDTCAFLLSFLWLTGTYHKDLRHKEFITPYGTVRHPKVKWREDDQSEDNEKPLLMFCRETGQTKDIEHITHNLKRYWMTGNGRFITLGYWAEVYNSTTLRCFTQVMQVVFFWFPFYWNDGAWKNRKWPIGNNWKRTDGYLQWVLCAMLTPRPFRKLVRKKTLKEKIRAYYSPEGTSGDWVVATHEALIERYF